MTIKNDMFKFNLQRFAVDADATKVADMVDPEVMADMISAELPNKIKFAPLATVDSTLQGRPGTTLTVPKFA